MLAEVIVDLRSHRLDRPLTYSIPASLEPRLALGSIVRVPLRSRAVRGWVVEVRDGDEPKALPVRSVSGRAPLFDEPLLGAMREVGRRYLAPLSSLLRLMTPPRLGRGSSGAVPSRPGRDAFEPELWRLGPGEDPLPRYEGLIRGALDDGRGALAMVPEVRQGSRVLDRLQSMFAPEAVSVHSDQDPAARSAALWSVALGEKRVVLGSRAAVFAPAFPVGVVIVHAEHDRSYKEQRSPYYDAREVALARGRWAGAAVHLVSPTPSLVTLARAEGWTRREPDRVSERAVWPSVEILEPVRTGIPRRAIAAIIEARRASGRVFVLVPRATSGKAGPGPERVGEFIERVVPQARVTRATAAGLVGESLSEVLLGDVVVATEAALAEVDRPHFAAAIALEVDSFLSRPGGRWAEEAFEILWSLGDLVSGEGRKGKLLIESALGDHHVVQAITRGDYHYFASRELSSRREEGSPPSANLIRLKARAFETELLNEISSLGFEVLGPAPGERGMEVMLRTHDLEGALDPLGEMLQRHGGVLAEVDPREW